MTPARRRWLAWGGGATAAALAFLVALPTIGEALGLAPHDLPEPGKAVEIRPGVHLNVVDEGSGPPVVLLHGTAGSAYDFDDLAPALLALGRRVVSYDRVGYGFSSRVEDTEGSFTLGSAADDLAALLDALGIQRTAVIGASYGGGVALMFASRYAARVSQLMLVASGMPPRHRGGGAPWTARTAFGRFLMRRAVYTPIVPSMVRTGLIASLGDERYLRPGWVERFVSMMYLPGALETWGREAERLGQTGPDPAAIKAPLLVIYGAHDLGIPRKSIDQLIEAVPGSELKIVEDGHHALLATHPGPINAWVTDFLARHP